MGNLSKKLKVLLCADLHDSGRGLWLIGDYIKNNQEIIGVIFAGDVVNMGEPVEFAKKFVDSISNFNIPLLWVPGNNDFGDSYNELQNHTKSLEGRIVKLGNREFTGVGGSPASWESEYIGENALSKKNIAGKIFVTHYPPNLVKLEKFDKGNSKSEYRNSKHVSDFGFRDSSLQRKIYDFPLAHICGHIHSTQGISYIGETKVIKLASSAFGNIAIMDLDSLEVSFLTLL